MQHAEIITDGEYTIMGVYVCMWGDEEEHASRGYMKQASRDKDSKETVSGYGSVHRQSGSFLTDVSSPAVKQRYPRALSRFSTVRPGRCSQEASRQVCNGYKATRKSAEEDVEEEDVDNPTLMLPEPVDESNSVDIINNSFCEQFSVDGKCASA